MKKCFLILSIIILLFVSVLPASAAVVPYGNVTEDTSQVKILIEAMLNDSSLMPFANWFVFRSGEYEYKLYFYNDGDTLCKCFTYSANNSGYNLIWHLSFSYVQLPEVDFNTYTVVGNISNTLGSQLYRQYSYYFLLTPIFILSFLVLVYYVFHHRRSFL